MQIMVKLIQLTGKEILKHAELDATHRYFIYYLCLVYVAIRSRVRCGWKSSVSKLGLFFARLDTLTNV